MAELLQAEILVLITAHFSRLPLKAGQLATVGNFRALTEEFREREHMSLLRLLLKVVFCKPSLGGIHLQRSLKLCLQSLDVIEALLDGPGILSGVL